MTKRLFVFMAMFVLIVGSTCLFSLVQVGEEVSQRFETPHPYSGKGLVWEQEFSWINEGYIEIHLSELDMANGE